MTDMVAILYLSEGGVCVCVRVCVHVCVWGGGQMKLDETQSTLLELHTHTPSPKPGRKPVLIVDGHSENAAPLSDGPPLRTHCIRLLI